METREKNAASARRSATIKELNETEKFYFTATRKPCACHEKPNEGKDRKNEHLEDISTINAIEFQDKKTKLGLDRAIAILM